MFHVVECYGTDLIKYEDLECEINMSFYKVKTRSFTRRIYGSLGRMDVLHGRLRDDEEEMYDHFTFQILFVNSLLNTHRRETLDSYPITFDTITLMERLIGGAMKIDAKIHHGQLFSHNAIFVETVSPTL
ncbi:hypothetical protein IGI04_041995 [Brassica rapa subsp. trilocularis]|uniref:Uncharacterized protein n=1 Tax=Brassica rapa subsp. trilocularis TaxID=1813537 RepID=A0ABQ7KVQ9_BRACM|nr:hypothetical protein IGI04_041995 [Brassica rapa subsp. trilocularis]